MWQTQALFKDNAIFGHTHRLSMLYTGDALGDVMVCGNSGWLGSKEVIDYRADVSAHVNYITGFTVGYGEPNGHWWLNLVPIIRNRLMLEGRIYR
jgi:hypothetical protein